MKKIIMTYGALFTMVIGSVFLLGNNSCNCNTCEEAYMYAQMACIEQGSSLFLFECTENTDTGCMTSASYRCHEGGFEQSVRYEMIDDELMMVEE